MHEICKQVYHIYLPQLGCNDLVPFIIPTSWMTRRWMRARWEPGVTGRNGSRLHRLPFALFTGWHLHSVLQRGELRWAAEMHHTALQMSHWATLYWASLFEVQLRHKSIHNITFSPQIKPRIMFIFHGPTSDLADVSLSVVFYYDGKG